MSTDLLNTLVTGAIWRAERLQEQGVGSVPLAWAEVSSLEEELAKALPASLPEGRIARRGAVANGGGDILWDPSHNYWLRVFAFGGGTFWQSATSLSTGQWSAKTAVDMSSLHSGMASRYPTYSAEEYAGGLYYGTLGGRTGMWMWVPVDYKGCINPCNGLGIVSTGLNFN